MRRLMRLIGRWWKYLKGIELRFIDLGSEDGGQMLKIQLKLFR